MANKAYRFRIYPNKEQRELFARTFGCVRFIYNKMLTDKTEHYNRTNEELHNTPAQYKEAYPWLQEVDSLALANAQLHLEAAYRNFFRSPETGFPKYKRKKTTRPSYTTNNVNGNIVLKDGKLKLPKAGHVKIKQHREVPEGYKLKSVTISLSSGGRYYASILYEYESQVMPVEPQTFVGLDFSMHELYVASSGETAEYPRYYRQQEEKLKKEQRKLSRMQKGSNNREKQREKVGKLHEKTANQRRDYLHKKSRQIANAYDCVCVEDLDMKAMSQSLHFGKSVSDNGWGMFTGFLAYKLAEQGKQMIKVGKTYPSSQLCSCCGYRNPGTKKLSVRNWECPVCGACHDRDINAAVNIRNEGMRILSA